MEKTDCEKCGNFIVRDKECIVHLYNKINAIPDTTNKEGSCQKFTGCSSNGRTRK